MAGVSTKEIKNRIRSMESTKQITKAMEMVAASKLRHAQAQVLQARPYFELIYGVIHDIARNNTDETLPYMHANSGTETVCYVVMAGDRGLAGGYNSNVLKAAYTEMQGRDAVVLPIGKKAAEFFHLRGIPLLSEHYADAEHVSVGDCFSVARTLCKAFLSGQFCEVRIVYTTFVSVLTQKAAGLKLLPIETRADILAEDGPDASRAADILYDPSPREVFRAIIPEYLGGVIYGALCESRASEQAARRSAMDTATQNAEEMIENLSHKFNQARQAAITQEITEIVAGS